MPPVPGGGREKDKEKDAAKAQVPLSERLRAVSSHKVHYFPQPHTFPPLEVGSRLQSHLRIHSSVMTFWAGPRTGPPDVHITPADFAFLKQDVAKGKPIPVGCSFPSIAVEGEGKALRQYLTKRSYSLAVRCASLNAPRDVMWHLTAVVTPSHT